MSINEQDALRQMVRAEVQDAVEPIRAQVAAAELNASSALQAAYRAEAGVKTLPQLLDQHFEAMQGTISREFQSVRADLRGHDAAIRRMVLYERAVGTAAGVLFNRALWGRVWNVIRRALGWVTVFAVLAGCLYMLSLVLS